jgi:hypothetical protein
MKPSAATAYISHQALTINVHYREDDGVEGSHSREKQGGCQASGPEPLCLSSEDAGCYEGIISMKNLAGI